jgi:hypothetical protein
MQHSWDTDPDYPALVLEGARKGRETQARLRTTKDPHP